MIVASLTILLFSGGLAGPREIALEGFEVFSIVQLSAQVAEEPR
jgi:hypothetical protein